MDELKAAAPWMIPAAILGALGLWTLRAGVTHTIHIIESWGIFL